MVSINPDGKGGTITKIGFDALRPQGAGFAFERVRFREVDLARYDISG